MSGAQAALYDHTGEETKQEAPAILWTEGVYTAEGPDIALGFAVPSVASSALELARARRSAYA